MSNPWCRAKRHEDDVEHGIAQSNESTDLFLVEIMLYLIKILLFEKDALSTPNRELLLPLTLKREFDAVARGVAAV